MGNMEILLQRHNVDCFGHKVEESCLQGLRTLTRFPEERRWYFYSTLRRVRRTLLQTMFPVAQGLPPIPKGM